MSHWTKCATKITDLSVLARAAKNLGVEVGERNKRYYSQWNSERYDAKLVFKYQDGDAAVIEKKEGGYELMIDNFNNPIVAKLGKDCCYLGREYSKLLVEQQAFNMGGMITSSTINSKGEVLMQISL